KKMEFPLKFWNVIGEGGYIGMLAPEEYGGTDFNAEDLVVFFESMAKKGLMSHQLINQVTCCDFLTKYGNPEQKSKYIPGIISGTLCSYANLEQSEGMSLFDISMSAVKEGNTYKLNGRKSYVAGAKGSANLIVAARTKPLDPENKKEGISLFLLDSNSKGIEMVPKELNVRVTGENEMMMITGDTFYEIHFNDVKISQENRIGRENSGGEYIDNTSSLMMMMMAATSIGWGENLLEMGVEYAKNRVIYEEPLGSYQAIQHPMVRAKTDLELAKLIIERAANAYDSEEDQEEVAIYAGMAKYTATEAAYNACDIAIQVHGGSGFDRDTGVITLWPLVLLSRIIPLNNDVILERYAEVALGLPASGLN
ncbi:MAG: acyl-CoA dehydrogenase, partial [Deltaproteobacteria bacterium]|nr:acyl-CoA dehydrogenase [Deltaproteobacteria bacterium]